MSHDPCGIFGCDACALGRLEREVATLRASVEAAGIPILTENCSSCGTPSRTPQCIRCANPQLAGVPGVVLGGKPG